jgi:type II secretory pathway pseudopilin PulG
MELVVVLAIIAVLAAIITPMIGSYVDRARVSTARADVRAIATAIVQFSTDTRNWPIYVDISDIPDGDLYDALASDGDVAAINGSLATGAQWTGGTIGDLRAVINQNSISLTTTGPRAWNGPYMNDVSTDPWGTKYYFNSGNLGPGIDRAVFVLSAGPDKTIDTEYNQAFDAAFVVGGDDLAHRIR